MILKRNKTFYEKIKSLFFEDHRDYYIRIMENKKSKIYLFLESLDTKFINYGGFLIFEKNPKYVIVLDKYIIVSDHYSPDNDKVVIRYNDKFFPKCERSLFDYLDLFSKKDKNKILFNIDLFQ